MNTTTAIARLAAANLAADQKAVRIALADWDTVSLADRAWFARWEALEASGRSSQRGWL